MRPLIIDEAFQPGGDRPGVARWPQPHIHFIERALSGRRTQRADQVLQFDCAGNMAAKLLRAFVAQTEALSKLQRGHSQTVRVEHVHVYQGG